MRVKVEKRKMYLNKIVFNKNNEIFVLLKRDFI